ncbi:MAG: NADH-quinone oxidoreductase subunit NuoG [Anaerolineae bacterium]|jgi:NADH-quinone oxidoreductase subunit G
MTVTLTIDGRQVTVPKGTLIVEAAKQLGVEIPVFCYHPKLESVGMCRMCLVTVGTPAVDRATGQRQLDAEGKPAIRWFPKPQTACTVPVSEGMVVVTDSEAVAADRKAILEFLLTSHPLDCPICDKGGECPLQDLTYKHGPGVSRFDYDSKHHAAKRYPLGDLIVLDQERCVLCARCTRFQAEIAHDPVLAIENRGRDAKIVSYSDPVFDSHYSGNTADICPVGALTSRDFRFRARPWELTNVPSLCNHCGVGCNTVLSTRHGEIARIMPRQNETVNEIWICDKGRFGHHFNGSPYRLTAPLIRQDGKLVETSWNEALQHVADRLAAIKEAHGPDAIGGIAGARLPNEDLYLFQKLLRQVIGTHNVDHRVGLSATIQDDAVYTVGVGTGTDLGRVGRDTAILVVGSDLDEEAPLLYLRVAGAARHGATLINAGGRPTKLDKRSTHVLRYRFGTATHLLLGMLHVILNDKSSQGRGLTGNEIVPDRVSGLEELRLKVSDWTPEWIAEITGVPADEIRAAARAFGEAKNGIILYGPEAGNDPALRRAVANLVTVTGFVGRPNNGVIAVLPHANSRGAIDLGIVPDRLPGYVPVERPGLSAKEMLDGGVRALLVAAADPLLGASRLEGLEFLVVQELFLTETAQQADVVLPAAAIAERDGTFTNLERRVQRFDPGLPVSGLARPDWAIIRQLAVLMGAEWVYATVGGVLAEMARTIPLYAGMSYERLSQPVSLSRRMSHYIYAGMSFQAAQVPQGEVREGIQWPTQAEDESTTLPLIWVDPPDPPAKDDGFTLVTPRVLYDGATLLGQAEILGTRLVQPHVALSHTDAQSLGVSNGDRLQVAADGRQVALPVQVDGVVPLGVIAIPRNLRGQPAESLLGDGRTFGRVKMTKLGT